MSSSARSNCWWWPHITSTLWERVLSSYTESAHAAFTHQGRGLMGCARPCLCTVPRYWLCRRWSGCLTACGLAAVLLRKKRSARGDATHMQRPTPHTQRKPTTTLALGPALLHGESTGHDREGMKRVTTTVRFVNGKYFRPVREKTFGAPRSAHPAPGGWRVGGRPPTDAEL